MSVSFLDVFFTFYYILLYGPRQAKKRLQKETSNMRKMCEFTSGTCAVSSNYLLSIETFYSIQRFCLRTAKALVRLRGCAGWSGPSLSVYARRHVFVWRGLYFTVYIYSHPFMDYTLCYVFVFSKAFHALFRIPEMKTKKKKTRFYIKF